MLLILHPICKTFLKVLGDIVHSKISQEAQSAGYFTVLADETKDVSKKEQLSIVVHFF